MNSSNSKIDYSLLDGMERAAFRRRLPWIIIIGLSAPMGLVGLLPDPALLVIYFAFFFVGLIGWWIAAKSKDEGIFKNFVTVNGFEYQPKVVNFGTGSLYSIGHSRHGRLGAAGYLDGWPVNFFHYIYSVGSGKSRRTYDSTVMWIGLPRVMPHMVIDSVVEMSNDGQSTLPIKFDKTQKIELEGDFAKYFDLYAPDSYGVSLLTVLAPDAMEALMKHAALCDIEIIDKNLYFYWPDTDNSRQGIESKFKTVQAVLSEIGDKLSHGDIYAHPGQAALHTTSTTGVRLEEKNSWLAIVFFAAVVIGARLSPESFLAVSGLPQLAIPVVLVGLTILRSIKRARLRRQLADRFKQY